MVRTTRNSYYKIATLAVLIIVAGYGVFFLLMGYIRRQSDSLAEYVVGQENWEGKLQEQSAYQKQYDDIVRREDLFQGLFLHSDDALSLIESVENLAKDNKLDINIRILEGNESVVAQDKQDDQAKRDETVVFQLSVVGAYTDFVRFLYKLENMDPVASLGSVSVQRFNQDEELKKQSGQLLPATLKGQPVGSEVSTGQSPETDAPPAPTVQPVKADISATFFYGPGSAPAGKDS